MLFSCEAYNYMHFLNKVLPDAATSFIGLCCSCAMKPMTEKITKPAKKLVPELTQQTIKESL